MNFGDGQNTVPVKTMNNEKLSAAMTSQSRGRILLKDVVTLLI